ncbi:MAG: hypothetical protein AAFY56_09790 [Pseudomonadota bacterium]
MRTENLRRFMARTVGLGIIALAALGVHGGAATSEEAVVLASTAPGYQTGKLLDPTGPISVPDDATLSLLFADGRMATLEGPYSGRLADATMAQMIEDKDRSQPGGWDNSAIGGTRSVLRQGEARPIVDVDLETGGRFCLDQSSDLRLYAPQSVATASIQNASTGELVHVSRDDNAYSLSWPETLVIERNSRFRISFDGVLQSDLQFAMLRSSAESTGEWLTFLRSSECDRQWQEELEEARDRLVPFDFYLTSSQGRAPVFSAQQPIDVYVRANRDGYVYCFVEDSAGRLLPIFPRDSWRAAVAGEQFIAVMARKDVPRLAQSLASGTLVARCLGADRDPGKALPETLRQANFRPAAPAARESLITQIETSADLTTGELRMELANN